MKAARTYCRHPGCGVRVEAGVGWCDRHRKAEHKRRDAGRTNPLRYLYRTYKWRRYSELRREGAVCVACLEVGVRTPAQHVDHIVRPTTEAEFWDEANHQDLCATCHGRKTVVEDGALAASARQGRGGAGREASPVATVSPSERAIGGAGRREKKTRFASDAGRWQLPV